MISKKFSPQKRYYDPIIRQNCAQFGSMIHVVGDDGTPVSKGYHSLYMRHGELFGKVGSIEERVTYNDTDWCKPDDKCTCSGCACNYVVDSSVWRFNE